MKRMFLIPFIFFFFINSVNAGAIYNCIDRDGNIIITDTPQDGLKCALKETFRESSPEELAEKKDIKKQKVFEEKNKIKSNEVILYTTSWCPYCKKARDFFTSRNISFTDYDIEKDKEAAERKRQLDTGSGVPFAIINGTKIHGFSPEDYEKALQKNP